MISPIIQNLLGEIYIKNYTFRPVLVFSTFKTSWVENRGQTEGMLIVQQISTSLSSGFWEDALLPCDFRNEIHPKSGHLQQNKKI